ncbi:MAG: ACP S-malonyltransferase [Helicobacteraceae bacterium]|jgi:[acyl-carrier-protein] S-malonyltransferase|nr:ACP S-malonyltransferase [Helicobacteraceae bacterium]
MKKIVAVFPGQGSQAIGMGKSFVDRYDYAKELLSEANDALGYDFSKLLFEENDLLGLTQYTQPSILLVSIIAYKLFESELPVKPLYALGHSLGELSAVCAVGGLSLSDALQVARARGEFMQKACEGANAGMMVTLGLSDEAAETLCESARGDGKKVWTANYNCDGQIVLAGIKADLESLTDRAKALGAKRAMLLDMSVASHCPLLSAAQEPLKAILSEKLNADRFIAPVISNAAAKPYQTKDEAIALLADQLVKPVLYKQSVAAIEAEADIFVEFGYANVLKGLNKKIVAKETIGVSNADDLEAAIEFLSKGEAR